MMYHTFHPGFGLIWLIVILLFVFWGPWNWRRRGHGDHHLHHRDHRPDDILAERFAKGEITEQEYQERLAVLKKNRG